MIHEPQGQTANSPFSPSSTSSHSEVLAEAARYFALASDHEERARLIALQISDLQEERQTHVKAASNLYAQGDDLVASLRCRPS